MQPRRDGAWVFVERPARDSSSIAPAAIRFDQELGMMSESGRSKQAGFRSARLARLQRLKPDTFLIVRDYDDRHASVIWKLVVL